MLDCFIDFQCTHLTSLTSITLWVYHFIHLIYFQKKYILLKINLCTLSRASLYNSLPICNPVFLIFFDDLSRFLIASEILGIMLYPSFFNRCYLINCNHNFLNEVIIDLSSAIKVSVVRKVFTSQSFLKKISRVMVERAEFNMFVRAAFNPINCSCTKNELMVRQSCINVLLSNSLWVAC